MNMNENKIESKQEKIPTREEVLEIISHFAENPILARELFDKDGLYLLEVKIENEIPGEFTEYEYTRKGKFPNSQDSSSTSIFVTFYKDEEAISGHNVADYDSEKGEWVEIK